MKALILKKAQNPLVYEEASDPALSPGQMLINLKNAALNRRDFWVTQGMYPDIKYPTILGSDGSGVVAEVGEGVDESWIGKQVIINPGYDWGDNPDTQSKDFKILGMPDDGTFAEKVAVPDAQVYEKPDHLDWPQAAALPLAGLTAYRALFHQGRLRKGEKVLITGIGGGVASTALQLATAAGATAIVTSSDTVKIDKALELGAAGGFLYIEEFWADDMQSQFGPVDLVIDGAAGDGYNVLIDAVRPGGRIVNYGATCGVPENLEIRKVFWKQLHLIGSTMGSPKNFADMLAFVKDHKIKPVIDSTLPLEEGPDAVEKMKTTSQFGKIVLNIDS